MVSKGTKANNFRLGPESERRLTEIADSREVDRTEVLRVLIAKEHARLSQGRVASNQGADPAQMILDEILSDETRLDH